MDLTEKFKQINTFIFDVDGVLTDAGILVNEMGEFWRKMNTKDGFGMRYAISSGYNMAIITGGNSKGVTKRLAGLGIDLIYTSAHHKMEPFQEICLKLNVSPQQCLYMGDDILDMEVIENAGIGACPKDAVWQVKNASDYISPMNGGYGAVRDVIEKTMSIQEKWPWS